MNLARRGRLFCAAILWLAAATAARPDDLPRGYAGWSLSPHERYVVAVPKFSDLGNSKTARDKILDADYRLLGVIEGEAGWDRPLNHLVSAPARWSSDDSYLLWEVDGEWGALSLVLVHLENGRLKAQDDLLAAAQQEILRRTRLANPRVFAEINQPANASAFFHGFDITVSVPGSEDDPIAFPLPIHVELNSNPQAVVGAPDLRSSLDAEVDPDGKINNVKFHFGDN